MSVNDPVLLRYNNKHDHYYLTRGIETFYNENRYMRIWETPEDAIIWCEEHLNCSPEIKEERPIDK